MDTNPTSPVNSDGFSRCEGQNQKTDLNLEAAVSYALWKDNVLRAIEQGHVEVRVHAGNVHLSGHIVNTASLARITSALRTVAGVGVVYNHLVVDSALTLEVAGALGALEHTYACKFFTGAAHGVISLNGDVESEAVKVLAEQCAADNPHVRGVVSRIRVKGSAMGASETPFLQPLPGATIYFLDGVSGTVGQVIIDPGTRRVMAMTVQGNFNGQPHAAAIVVPMSNVRHLTKTSGFLTTNSQASKEYTDFDAAHFRTPELNWLPPHPYCPANVLLTEARQGVPLPAMPLEVVSQEQVQWEQLLASDSLGG